jgi:integrase
MRDLRIQLADCETFQIHDLRRTVRTGLSRLNVDEATAELVLGHVPQGIKRVYDRHNRLDERRKALQRWADFVSLTVNSTNAVVPLVRSA